MLEILILSITSFIGTNIDDFIIDIFFFSAAENKKDMVRVVLGKYLGISILVLISLIGALGLEIMPVQHIEVLGFVPIGLGIKEIFSSMWENEEDNQNMPGRRNRNLFWSVSLITIANGADNIGVYVPLFTGFTGSQYILFSIIFMVMIVLWCALGYAASKVPILEKTILKYKKIIVPGVYILLGVYILNGL